MYIKLSIVCIKRNLATLFPNGIFDPIAELNGAFEQGLISENDIDNTVIKKSVVGPQKVHIRLQKRNARKCITTVEGLPSNLNHKKLVKELKKKFSCNGVVISEEEGILQLQGDQRHNLSVYLVDESICAKRNIVIHGY
jgi:translation initiation factor 1